MRGQFGKRGPGGGPGSGVTTFNGRNGNVTSIEADYSAFFIPLPIPQTVADVQVNNGTYTEGTWIIVTDNIGSLGGSSGTIFAVGSGGYIQPRGWCRTYLSSAMDDVRAVYMDWEPFSDFVSCIEEPEQGNKVTSFFSSIGLEGFPFDTTSIGQTTLIDPSACNIGLTAIIYAATFEGYNSITIPNGCTFSGRAGREATVVLSDTSTFVGEVNANGGVTLFGTQSLTWFKIFPNVNVNLIGKIRNDYSVVGGFVSQTESTLLFRQSDLDGSSELDMASNGGIMTITDFSSAGILAVTSDGVQSLNQILGFVPGRKYKIIPDVSSTAPDLTVSPFPVGSGNIYLETGFDLVLKGGASPVDYLELVSDIDDTAKLVQCGGANYVI